MPYAQCPNCQLIGHLSVDDVQQWFAERHPGLSLSALAPEHCPGCLWELRVGMLVSVLDRPICGEGPRFSGKIGVVRDIELGTNGETIYLVDLAPHEGTPEWQGNFQRTDLWWIPSQRDPRLK